MTAVRVLLLLGTAFLAPADEVRASPTRYDQRQEGELNVHAQLENFLLVAAIPGNIADVTMGVLEQAVSRSKERRTIKSDEVARQEGPYPAEILQRTSETPGKESTKGSVGEAVGGDAGTSNVSDQRPTPGRIARNVKNFEFPKSREVPPNSGHLANARKTLGPKKGSGQRARNVDGNAWHSDVEPAGRPGASLKKQLSPRGEEDVALPSSNADGDDVPPIAEKKRQELRLLGDGLENCGPGRRRDASGVCQLDGSADSLL